jgi:phenylacetate-CoA ligase
MTDERYTALSEEALDRALFRTRAYAPWKACDPGEGRPLEERYAALPTTDKAFIRAASPDGLVPDDKDLSAGLASGEVEFVSTSGTTDERVTNVWNQRWWNFSERESWKLNAVTAAVCTGSHREAILTSARNVGFLSDERNLSREERTLGRLLFLNERSSPLLWTRETVERMARELREYLPDVLEANPSYLARFSLEAQRLGLSVPEPKAIVFTYENPSALHLRQIRRLFSAPLVSSYGTTEAGYAFMECEHGALHQNSASCRVDYLGLAGGEPGVGTIRITPFGNEWVSLLRFDPGDIVRLRSGGACACGRNGAVVLGSIEGRVKSLTRTAEGRPVTPAELDRVLAREEALVAYQLLQEGRSAYRLLAALETGSPAGAGERLRELAAGLYGPEARIRVERRETIEPEPSGKFLPAKIVTPA